MKNTVLSLLCILLVSNLMFAQKTQIQTATEKEVMAARQVMMRVVGMKSEAFSFEKIPAENGLDVYEVTAVGGKVKVKGSSTIAMTRAAYDYIRKACNLQYTWSSDKLVLPASLPDLTIARTVSPYKFRQYYNVCAYGYTTAFWKWEDWQKELDWMALHGINMPVAMAGQEAVWQKVYREMGMTDPELKNYFAGPAFLPWQRMGNVNKHAGPLPQDYIDGQRDLQKQLIERMLQLGMQPIVPAFSGFVPEAYKRLYPDAKLLEVKGWCNFPDTNQSYILPPGSADFVNIGKKFIEEYQKTYGKVHYYLADLFNENEVPVSNANRYNELAGFGKSVYDAINAGDPEGTWVMQGWLFFNNQQFWDKPSVKAFLSEVPNDRMLIIDLANEVFHGWEKLDNFYGKPWIYSVIHNYGGNSQMIGNLPHYASDAAAMLANAKKGNMTGFGISPEGIQNNEVVYELLTDLSWSSKAIDIKAWLKDYVKQRYGKDDDKLFYAWTGLLESIYSNPIENPRNIYQNRPRLSPATNLPDNPAFDQAVASFLTNAAPYMTNPRFKHDLVQLTVQYAGEKTDKLINRALEVYLQGDTAKCAMLFNKVQELMIMMDALTYTLPEQRLETWIGDARKWGKLPTEGNYYEENAKRQVTVWGNSNTAVLYEYAAKVWSGLIRDYYLGRWLYFSNSLITGTALDLNNWEENWITKPGLNSKAAATGDVLAYALALYNAAGEAVATYTPQVSINAKYAGNNQAVLNIVPNSTNQGQEFTALKAAETGKAAKTKKEDKKAAVKEEAKTVKAFYTTDGSSVGMAATPASQTDKVTLPALVKAAAFYDNKNLGDETSLFLPISFGKPVTVNPAPTSKYASAPALLNDAIKGSPNFKDGKWMGFEGDNMNATIDLEQSFKVSKVTINYLDNGNSWIFPPSAMSIQISEDGKKFTTIYSRDFDTHYWSAAAAIKKFTASFPEETARYIKVIVFNQGTCPKGSYCEGKKSWMFLDEITVE
ncbi:MAG: alpha-N-acetylglucosaminidase C-terminal domain-containing protein [Bacteroidales bacterium]|nr:alpha-N-acetylglucosaminidase C-terminal domain-containing protein [Bacteroidales bacterium]